MDNGYQDDFLRRRKMFLNTEYKSSLRQILSYLWEYKKPFIIILIFGIVQSMLFLTVPLFLGPAIDILSSPTNAIFEALPIFIVMIVVQLVVGVLFGIRIYINRWIGANVIFNLRNDLFATIQMMSYSWLDENKSGELLARTTSDVNNLKEFLAGNLQFFVRQATTFLFSFLILFLINDELAIYIVAISPALFLVLIVFRRKMRPVFKKSRETYADVVKLVQEDIGGIHVIKAFSTERHEKKNFSKKNDTYFDDSMAIIKLQAKFDPIIYLIDNLSFLIVLLYGGVLVFDNSMSFGDLFAFIMVLNFSVEPLNFMARFIGNMPQISETSERVAYILNSRVTVKEKEKAIELPPITGEVEFKNVSFSFTDTKDHRVLKNINLKVKPGENIAILGATGSGKSSLVNLIPRFYDASDGEVLIDGVNIKDVSFKSLRKQIGFVSQERLLFSRSIRDNIALGNKEISIEEIEQVAKTSDIHKFIDEEMPEKYETKVSERGKTVSGGQKQRIAIARALAIKPRILILDDATSSVDVDTEYAIQQNFKDVFKECTTFLITQRLSSVRNADRIIVLDKGEITQVGTHQELMNQEEGIYKKLYRTLEIKVEESKVEERA
jgi:ATP-binding cassette subfamily B protein